MSYHSLPPQHVVRWTAADKARWQSRKRLDAILSDPVQTAALYARLGLVARPGSSPAPDGSETRRHAPGPADGAAAGGLT